MKCQLCKVPLWKVGHSGMTTNFFCDVHAMLCCDCRSAMDNRVESHQLWQEHVALQARYDYLVAAAARTDTEERMVSTAMRMQDIQREFWAILREWIPPFVVDADDDDGE